jgi:hypothetical protein
MKKIHNVRTFVFTLLVALTMTLSSGQAFALQDGDNTSSPCATAIKAARATFSIEMKAAQDEFQKVLSAPHTKEDLAKAKEAYKAATKAAHEKLRTSIAAAPCQKTPKPEAGNDDKDESPVSGPCADAIKAARSAYEVALKAAQETLKKSLEAAKTPEEAKAARDKFQEAKRTAKEALHEAIKNAPCPNNKPKESDACADAVKKAHEAFHAAMKAAQKESATTKEEREKARDAFAEAVKDAKEELQKALAAAPCSTKGKN